MGSLNQIQMTFMLWFMGEAVCHHVLQEENVQKLVNSTDLHFDLVVIEAFYGIFLGIRSQIPSALNTILYLRWFKLHGCLDRKPKSIFIRS
jgi:septum formation inhibitor-activating ATPase MinD